MDVEVDLDWFYVNLVITFVVRNISEENVHDLLVCYQHYMLNCVYIKSIICAYV